MDVFPIRADEVLAGALAAAFALGLIAHRLFTSRRENQIIEQLNDQIARLEKQGDAAHRVALDLAARHNQLVGAHHEAEWSIRSLKSELERRDAMIERTSEGAESQGPAVKREFWSAQKNQATGSLN